MKESGEAEAASPGRGGVVVTAVVLAAVIAIVLTVVEHRRRVRAEHALQAAFELSLALARTGQWTDARVPGKAAAATAAARRGRLPEAAASARTLAEELAPALGGAADAQLAAACRAYFKAHEEQRQELLALAALGAAADREGRDAAALRQHLSRAVASAKGGDETGVTLALQRGRAASGDLPFRASERSVAGDGDDDSRARALLLECEQPLRTAQDTMLEGAPAAGKLFTLARARLAAGAGTEALWLAELVARLLGLRSVAAPDDDTIAEQGKDMATPVPLQTAEPGHVRRMLELGGPLLQSMSASRGDAQPAEQVLAEADRFLERGDTAAAAMFAKAGLNILGMTDQAIADLQQGGQEPDE